jgi:hypothetical protein
MIQTPILGRREGGEEGRREKRRRRREVGRREGGRKKGRKEGKKELEMFPMWKNKINLASYLRTVTEINSR